MDAKTIFIASNYLRKSAHWEKASGLEWRFCGNGTSFERNMIEEEINTFFQDDEIYISLNRTTGQSISKSNVADKIAESISMGDIRLTDHQFKKIIEFSHYGVFRKGNKELS